MIEIYKVLPRTNCARCGSPTCIAFAAELRAGKAKPEQCPILPEADREKLKAMLSA